MIKALLKSEWIKFRSYYLALGAILAFLVLIPFFMMNLDYTKTAIVETKALSEALHALYLAQPAIVVVTALYFAQEFAKSAMRTNFLAVANRKAWLAGKFGFFFLLLLALYSIVLVTCFAVMLTHFHLAFSWTLLREFFSYASVGLLSNFSMAFLTAGLALMFQSWIVPVSVLFPLLIGLSRALVSLLPLAKYLPDLATLNLFEYESLQVSMDLSGLGIQLIWLILIGGSAIFLTLKRDIR